MSKLIIVCGLTASGKTTLANELSSRLHIPCLHKDIIKENLYEIFEFSTLEDSKALGSKSMRLLYALAENQIKHGIDLILEAPFIFPEDYEIFRSWQNNYGTDVYAIICSMNLSEREARYRSRPRHHAHHDPERRNLRESGVSEKIFESLPGKKIKITTDRPVSILIEELLKSIN